MNLQKGFLRLTITLSIIGGVFGFPIGMAWSPMHYDYETQSYISHYNFLGGLLGFFIGIATVWAIYGFIKYVIAEVIKYIIAGLKATGKNDNKLLRKRYLLRSGRA